MRNKWWIILLIIIILVIFFIQKPGKLNLITPFLNQGSKENVEMPNPTPNAPKQYKFDSTTDLKKELEQVDPQVLDSDFE